MNIRVVVPIYNAYDVFINLLYALKQHNVEDDVLFINDASTDTRIEKCLADLPSKWQVVHNKNNLGFVKTANIGLQSTTGHSVLLNSDTLISKNWLVRMKQVVDKVKNLGTATPWSNNAEICSIPKTLHINPQPKDIDRLAEELTHVLPRYPELPTAVGFCMLISAQAKQQVGYFDEQVFGMGYGEENDYSLRVTQAGLRNVLVDNCYVAHVGNQSFQEMSLKPGVETMARLLSKHPNYLKLIQNFIENDPLNELRASIIGRISSF
ncbi:MAG: glycosyltransferase family 2 protein [Xanthomonadales bacterium]|nr:glycosyltransferase family 2 protein [Xanthomonadales bacterium]